MKTYTIENETNNITVHLAARQAQSVVGAQRFATAAALARLAAHWPPARLVEIWNSLPGATPVKKFKDRATAVSRIWKALQSLDHLVPGETSQLPDGVPAIDVAAAVAESDPHPQAVPNTLCAPQTPDVAPKTLPPQAKARGVKEAPVAATSKGVREGSKTEKILGLLQRQGGVTLKEIMKATGWQAHSVRGFISGTLSKKMSLTVVSSKTGDGERNYSL